MRSTESFGHLFATTFVYGLSGSCLKVLHDEADLEQSNLNKRKITELIPN